MFKGLVFFNTSVGGWSNLESNLFIFDPPSDDDSKYFNPPHTHVQIIWTPLIPRPPPYWRIKKDQPLITLVKYRKWFDRPKFSAQLWRLTLLTCPKHWNDLHQPTVNAQLWTLTLKTYVKHRKWLDWSKLLAQLWRLTVTSIDHKTAGVDEWEEDLNLLLIRLLPFLYLNISIHKTDIPRCPGSRKCQWPSG